MAEQGSVDLLILLSRTIKFASDHPYAATGIFGAAIGSALTYQALTHGLTGERVSEVFTPKVYELVLQREDMQKLLQDPTAELRWETPDMTVIVSTEKREPLKQLPVIDAD